MSIPPSSLISALRTPNVALAGIVTANFLGISLWFGSSAALPSLIAAWSLTQPDIGLLVSAVQAGFILGTFIFAITNLADRINAGRVFLVSALVGAGANLLFASQASGLGEALVYRFVTGFAMAGIIPVGMKIVVSWGPEMVGKSLGWLTGAVVMGSGIPFFMAFVGAQAPWRTVLASASAMAVISGLMVVAIGNGPHLQPARKVELKTMFRVFAIAEYRGAALGYFGHMWELYAFWVLTPLLVATGLAQLGVDNATWTNLGTFAVFVAGAAGCVIGGLISMRVGSRRVAAVSLAVSATLCLILPALIHIGPWFFLLGLLIWGAFVVSDSAQFSAMSSLACPPEYVATALTVQNGIGFAITIASIEFTTRLWSGWGLSVVWLLAAGPVLGLVLLLHPRNRLAPQTAMQVIQSPH